MLSQTSQNLWCVWHWNTDAINSITGTCLKGTRERGNLRRNTLTTIQIPEGEEHSVVKWRWLGRKKGNLSKHWVKKEPLLFKTIGECGHTYSVVSATCYAVSVKENRALFCGCKQNQNDRNTWTMDSLSCTVGKCPSRLTMPDSSAQWSPNSCYEGSTDVNQKGKKAHWPIWPVSQPSLQLSPLPSAVSSDLSLTEPALPPLRWNRKRHIT